MLIQNNSVIQSQSWGNPNPNLQPQSMMMMTKKDSTISFTEPGSITSTGESYESFDRKRALVKFQSQSKVIKMMLYCHTFEEKKRQILKIQIF